MKKFLSIIISASFLFTSLFTNISVNAKNFDKPNLGIQKIYYGTITGELKSVKNKKRTIFLLQEKNGTIHQIFSSRLVGKIKNFYLGGNQVKILGQSYKNPNNGIYAGIFVNKIRDFSKNKKKIITKNKHTTKLTNYQKTLIYSYLSSTNSRDKFLKGRKIFGNINLKSLYKEMHTNDRKGKVDKDLLSIIKYLTTDSELNLHSKEFKKLEKTSKEFNSLDKNLLKKIKSIGFLKIKKILSFDKNSVPEEYKFIYNELKNIDGFENLLNKKIDSEKINFSDKNYQKFSKIINYKIKEQKLQFLFKNEKTFNNILLSKKKEITPKSFSDTLKANIILDQIEKNSKLDIFLPLNQINSERKVKIFLINNDTEKIKKTAFLKDFQSVNFQDFKINFPQNFDFEKINLGNEIYSKIYFKDFYSNILSFDLNKVQNFKNRNGEISVVKIAGDYGKKIISDEKIYFQLKNKKGEKFEISYSILDKNFTNIFENILNKVEKK